MHANEAWTAEQDNINEWEIDKVLGSGFKYKWLKMGPYILL